MTHIKKFYSFLTNKFDIGHYQIAGFKSRSTTSALKKIARQHNITLGVYDEDYFMVDERGGTGLYLLPHADQPVHLSANYESHKNSKKLSSLELSRRFIWIWELFSSPNYCIPYRLVNSYWKNSEEALFKFKEEKENLVEDPLLSIYWLLHFGLLVDPLVQEVKTTIGGTTDELVLGALEFLDQLGENCEFKLEYYKGSFYDFSKAFKKSRYESVFSLYLRDSSAVQQLLLSYKYASEGYSKKSYWLVKQLNQSSTWDDFQEQLDSLDSKIPAFEYIKASNPTYDKQQRAQSAEKFLTEMIQQNPSWKKYRNSLALIYNVHDMILDKSLLKKAISKYFTDDLLHQSDKLISYYNEMALNLSEFKLIDLDLCQDIDKKITELKDKKSKDFKKDLEEIKEDSKTLDLFIARSLCKHLQANQIKKRSDFFKTVFLLALHSNNPNRRYWLTVFSMYRIDLKKLEKPFHELVRDEKDLELLFDLFKDGKRSYPSEQLPQLISTVVTKEPYFSMTMNFLRNLDLSDKEIQSDFGEYMREIFEAETSLMQLNKDQCEQVLELALKEIAVTKYTGNSFIRKDFTNPAGLKWFQHKLKDQSWLAHFDEERKELILDSLKDSLEELKKA